MSVLTVRVPDELDKIINQFCKEEDRTKSWLVKKAIQEKLEDWSNYRDGVRALKEHKKNPELAISHDELIKKLGLTQEEISK
ncbi:MAG: putative DNA-binding protein [Rickettsiales bacterium]|jgi:predicted DNA-binding protein